EDALKAETISGLVDTFAGDDRGLAEKQLKAAFRSLSKNVVRRRIVEDGFRIDGRGPADLRPLSSEVGVLPRVHGSGLFQRGETQVLNITTLGMKRMDQMIDGIDPVDRKRYMHHYNFPPFSTGETGFMRGPKRREIGHGLLAERALVPVVPDLEEWPYTLRLVSEVLSSNGSTSMASVCGSSLSLMDAGVPIKAPVAGIAMGLVYAEGKYTTLTDILGAEDAFGDMDFKVAGTSEFVTALQLDTKIDGIPADVLADALNQAKEARLEILAVMASAIEGPRDDVREGAPKIISFEIPVDKIGEVIGPKGKVINSIQSETGADISVDDDGVVGVVAIAATDKDIVDEAERQIRLILDPPTADVGEDYDGRVVNITKFGAFVNILPGRDGLLHISKIGQGKRIDRVEDVLELGQEVKVTVEDIDPNGKISLKMAGDENDYTSGGGGGRDRGRNGDRDRGGRDRGGRDRGRGGSATATKERT
ncbi:MAG: polyribonucleotide nucleotidyltransferase, partial [Actinomycetota bacterium]